jgi:hypothetical protein
MRQVNVFVEQFSCCLIALIIKVGMQMEDNDPRRGKTAIISEEEEPSTRLKVQKPLELPKHRKVPSERKVPKRTDNIVRAHVYVGLPGTRNLTL